MQYFLVSSNADGTCQVIAPLGEFWNSVHDQEKGIQYLHTISIPNCVEFIACTKEKIPSDLTFRKAWIKGDALEPIKIDFQRALEIHRQRLKDACAQKIELLQTALVIALEKDNLPEATSIRRTSLILRSLAEKMDLSHCKTIDDIKYSIPKELHDVWTLYSPKP